MPLYDITKDDGTIPPKHRRPVRIVPRDFSGYGLQVDGEGVIRLNGKPFYGMGVNYFPAFCLCLDDYICGMENVLEPHFRKFAEGGIPCCRVMFGVFYGDQVKLWSDEETKSRYFAAMDYLVSLGEKYNVGIIASLFWNVNAFNDVYGEPLDLIADPESRSGRLRLAYIRDVVGRYKYSPAIWAWEIGNELSLACESADTAFDTSKGERTPFLTEYLTGYYRIISAAIRAEDPYRMITGGDAAPRVCSMAWYQSRGKRSYPENTYEDDRTVMSWYAPGDVDTISMHYPLFRLVRDYARAAKELKKALYMGEWYGELFSNPGDALSPDESVEEAHERSTWYDFRNLFYDCGIQLTTCWTYGTYSQGKQVDVASIELGVNDGFTQNVYQYEGLREINARYAAEGKTDAVSYWKNAVNAIVFDTGEEI